MKKLKFLISLLILFAQTASLSAEPLIRELCCYSEGDVIFGGKYKKEIEEWKASRVVLHDEVIDVLIQMYSDSGNDMNLVLYIYDGKFPYVSLDESDVSFIDLMNSACIKVGYVYWFENHTVFMVPKDQLEKHRNTAGR